MTQSRSQAGVPLRNGWVEHARQSPLSDPVLFAALRPLAGPGHPTKISHKFMWLRAMELVGSVAAGAAGARAEYRAAKPRQSARTRRCRPAHRPRSAQCRRAPPSLARQARQSRRAGAEWTGQLRGRRQTAHHVQSDQIRIDLLANAHKGLDHRTADFTAQHRAIRIVVAIAAASVGVMLATAKAITEVIAKARPTASISCDAMRSPPTQS
jgi:hypothetical protein